MAATVSDLANGVSTTSNTTCATGATVTASVGDWLVVLAASSNDGTGGAASQTGVVDSDGVNTYTQRALINYDPAAAGAGATLGIYTCEVTQALSNDTITVNHSGNTDHKAVQVYKVAPGASELVSFIEADTTGSTGNATSHTAAQVSVASGDIIFGGAAIETDDAVTGDTDTTNGNWSSVLTRLADGGADASTMSCASQHKTTTGAGNQDWACSTASGRDSARTYLVLRSAVPSSELAGTSTSTFTPAGTMTGAGALAGSATLTITPSGTMRSVAVTVVGWEVTITTTTTVDLTAGVFGAEFGIGAGGNYEDARSVPGEVANQSITIGELDGINVNDTWSFRPYYNTDPLDPVGTRVYLGDLEVSVPEFSLDGDVAFAFSSTATLAGDGALAGTSTVAFAPAGSLQGSPGEIFGVGTVAFSPAATLIGDGALVGVSTATFTPAGALSGAGVTVSGNDITAVASTIDITAGVFGVEFGIDDYEDARSVPGAASSQTITIGALDGVTIGDDWKVRPYYNLDPLDPIGTRVYLGEFVVSVVDAGAMTGSATMTFTLSAALPAAGALAGAGTVTFTPSATFLGAGALAGAGTVAFTPSGTAAGDGTFTGSSTVSIAPAATLDGPGALVGSGTVTFAPTGTFDVPEGFMFGESLIEFQYDVFLVGDGALVGTSNMAFSLSAAYDDPDSVPPDFFSTRTLLSVGTLLS